jgi:hypothetical protein
MNWSHVFDVAIGVVVANFIMISLEIFYRKVSGDDEDEE